MNKKILGILLIVMPILQLFALLVGFSIATFAVAMVSSYVPPASAVATSTESTMALVQMTQALVLAAFGFFAGITSLMVIICVPLGLWLIIRGDKKWPEKFAVKDLLALGWQKMADNFWFFAGILLIAFVLRNASSIINQLLGVNWNTPDLRLWTFWLSMVVIAIFFIIQLFVQVGLMQISLKVVAGKTVKTLEIFAGWDYKLIWKFFLSSIIYIAIILGGLILLVVPGIIWAIKFQYFGYFVIEGAGPLEAIKKSGRLTKGAILDILTLNVVSGLINLAGVMAMGVGLFATMPLTMVAQASSFRELQEAQGEK